MNIPPLGGPIGPESAKPLRESVEISKFSFLMKKAEPPSTETILSELNNVKEGKINFLTSYPSVEVSATAIIIALRDLDS